MTLESTRKNLRNFEKPIYKSKVMVYNEYIINNQSKPRR